MPYTIARANVWAAELEDHPGALGDTLAILHRAGANPEFVILRPSAPMSSIGVLFVAPLVGPQEAAAAAAAGLRQSESMYSLRITGPDYPGLLAELTRALGHAGINIHGASAASIEGHCVIYLRFECEADVPRAEQVLRSQLGPDTCPPALPPV